MGEVVRRRHIVTAATIALVMPALGVGVAYARPAQSQRASSAGTSTAAAGRTLQIAVTGLPRGVRARVQVIGPAHFSRRLTRTTTLRGLRAGSYRVDAARVNGARGSHIYPASHASTVKVTGSRGATAHVRYTTVVPGTTRAIPARSITAVKRVGSRRIVHLAGRPGLQVGNIVAAGVGPSTPEGLLAKVTAVGRDGSVTVAPATLLQAIPQGQLDTQMVLSSANVNSSMRRSGMRVASNGSITQPVNGPLGSCTGDAEASVSGSVSILPAFHFTAAWSLLHGVTSAQLTADVTESSELKAGIDAAGSCDGTRKLFARPRTFATFVVDIGGIPIVLQPQLQLTLTGHAGVEAAITTSASQQLRIGAGLRYTRADGIRPVETVTRSSDYQPPTLTASGEVRVSVNPEINLLIDGTGGPEVGLTGGLDLTADVDDNPWWKLTGYLAGNAGIAIPLLKIDKRVELARKTWQIAHAPLRATPQITVTPDDASPWSDAVCGTHADDADLEITGTGFHPGERVDLDTDWTDYGDITADSRGAFDVIEPVGEVPSADHGDYGVYASGADGSNASSSVGLNSDTCWNIVDDSNGQVSLQWGANGLDPDTELDLLIDGDYTDSATTDDFGSGGSTVTFDCPDSGEFDLDTEGTDNDHGESLDGGPVTLSCDPPAAQQAAPRSRTSSNGRDGSKTAGDRAGHRSR